MNRLREASAAFSMSSGRLLTRLLTRAFNLKESCLPPSLSMQAGSLDISVSLTETAL